MFLIIVTCAPTWAREGHQQCTATKKGSGEGKVSSGHIKVSVFAIRYQLRGAEFLRGSIETLVGGLRVILACSEVALSVNRHELARFSESTQTVHSPLRYHISSCM